MFFFGKFLLRFCSVAGARGVSSHMKIHASIFIAMSIPVWLTHRIRKNPLVSTNNQSISMRINHLQRKLNDRRKKTIIQSLRAFRRAYPQHPILPLFRPSHSSANDRYVYLESNALTGIEFYEVRKKLKNLEFRHNSVFWEFIPPSFLLCILSKRCL